jgi:hypothetical protein
MSNAPRKVVYESSLFRVEEQPIEGCSKPFTFVKRIGAVTILPVVFGLSGPQALTIDNKRQYYGTSALSLPSGNAAGGHERPEPPDSTTLRELREETGYGYPDSAKPNMDIFALRTISNTIDYPRYFAVVRDVEYLGGEDDNPNEVITLRPTPLEEYTDELLRLANGRIYPEVNSAFAKAGMECGREAVLGWLTGDLAVASATDVPQSLEPWLLRV